MLADEARQEQTRCGRDAHVDVRDFVSSIREFVLVGRDFVSLRREFVLVGRDFVSLRREFVLVGRDFRVDFETAVPARSFRTRSEETRVSDFECSLPTRQMDMAMSGQASAVRERASRI
jgi:hypothetical protein